MKFNKCFLRRSPLPLNLKSSDFFLGAKVLVYSRLMTIIDFGDPCTRRHLAPSTDSSAILLGPDCNENLGKVFADIVSAGMKIIDIQSVLLEESESLDEVCEVRSKIRKELLLTTRLLKDGPSEVRCAAWNPS